jgi:hypothetical protein
MMPYESDLLVEKQAATIMLLAKDMMDQIAKKSYQAG